MKCSKCKLSVLCLCSCSMLRYGLWFCRACDRVYQERSTDHYIVKRSEVCVEVYHRLSVKMCSVCWEKDRRREGTIWDKLG